MNIDGAHEHHSRQMPRHDSSSWLFFLIILKYENSKLENVTVQDAKRWGVSSQMTGETLSLLSYGNGTSQKKIRGREKLTLTTPGDSLACIARSSICPGGLLHSGTPCTGHVAKHCRFHTEP